MDVSPFSPPINFTEELKRLFVLTAFERTKSVFIINDENGTFSSTTIGHWSHEKRKI